MVHIHLEGVERFVAVVHSCEKRVGVCAKLLGEKKLQNVGCYLHFIDFNLE